MSEGIDTDNTAGSCAYIFCIIAYLLSWDKLLISSKSIQKSTQKAMSFDDFEIVTVEWNY